MPLARFGDRGDHFPRIELDSTLVKDFKSVGLKQIGVVVRK